MPAFDRLSPNFIKNFLGRIKHPRNFLPANVAESDGILSVLRPFNEGECRKDGEDGFYNKELFNYGFEISPIPIRFGKCFTSDIGHEVDNLRPKNPLIITDKNVGKTRAMKEVSQSLLPKTHITYDIYDKVSCEPTDKSLKDAIQHVRSKKYDCFIAVGGGSVMDTARIVNLFASNPKLDIDDLLKHQIIDFKNEKYLHHLINTHGKHTSSGNPVYPLISIPTTISLGSESAGGLTFRVQEKNCMATICADAVKPNLILADPLNVLTMPKHVATYGAFDVLIHALESFTIKAFTPHISNMPNVTGSELQTVFRASNYISDIWSMETLQIMHKYLSHAILEPEDGEAKSQLMMAAAFSGMDFRNPLIRFCHTLSYPIRILGKHYADPDYAKTSSLIPHGLAVAMVAPVAFMFSAYADPQRHLEAAKVLGADVQYKASSQQIGHALADVLRGYIKEFQLPNGLSELGFKSKDLYKLAELAVENFKPAASTSKELDKEILREIYEEIWKIY